jgi:hypothetical protein
MKNVPSGRDDFCMYGALAVKGITRVGIPAPAIVGRPVRWKALSVKVPPFLRSAELLLDPVGSFGALVILSVPCVLEASLFCVVLVPSFVCVVLPVACAAVEL